MYLSVALTGCARPCRYHTDPSGTLMRFDAKAIGSGSEAAQSELQDKWYKVRCSARQHATKLTLFQQITLLEAQKLTLRVLKQVMEEKLDHHNVQLAQVTPGKGFEILDEVKLKEIIDVM